MTLIRVGPEVIDSAQAQSQLTDRAASAGAIVTFMGCVRTDEGVETLTLEHYPAMTDKVLAEIAAEACARWPIEAYAIKHRVGEMRAGDVIVFVGVATKHRAEAFEATAFLMDQLKTRAAFWKKESGASGAHWVEERKSDIDAAASWSISNS